MTSSFSTVSTEGFSSDPTSSSRARRESFMRTNRASVFQNNWKDSIDQVVEEESMGGTAFRTGQRHLKDPNLLLTGTEQRRSSALESFVRRLTFDELSLDSSLQGRTSAFNNTGMSAFDSTRSDSTTPPPTTDGSRFKTTAHSIRQSLAVLINTRAGSGSQGMPNLCSGTINGRGSFMTEHAVERQLRFQMYDCLERVLQDSTRIRRLYDFMKRQQCPELLEFWSIVELYQNLYWKPFKLMGINLNIQVKRSPEELDEEEEEDETKESTKAPAKKEKGGQQLLSEKEKDKGSLLRHTTLAKTLAKFTLEQEETLRGEIIYYYIEDEAPLQICLPSQMREKTLKTAARASELPDEDRLSMFREAQKFCYDELQRIHMPKFLEYEQKNVDAAGDSDMRAEVPAYSPALAAVTSSMLAADVLDLHRATQPLQPGRRRSSGEAGNGTEASTGAKWW